MATRQIVYGIADATAKAFAGIIERKTKESQPPFFGGVWNYFSSRQENEKALKGMYRAGIDLAGYPHSLETQRPLTRQMQEQARHYERAKRSAIKAYASNPRRAILAETDALKDLERTMLAHDAEIFRELLGTSASTEQEVIKNADKEVIARHVRASVAAQKTFIAKSEDYRVTGILLGLQGRLEEIKRIDGAALREMELYLQQKFALPIEKSAY